MSRAALPMNASNPHAPVAQEAAQAAPMSLDAGIASLHDYEARARQCLAKDVWAYLHGAAADGISAQRNEQAFQSLELLPRVLRNASGGNTALKLLGQAYEHPIFIAPTAYHALAHPDAELATALAASVMKAGFVVSTQASRTLESIAGQAQAPLWFQLYMQSRREVTQDLVRRAEGAGYQAIVVTVDAPIQGLRNEEQRQGFCLPAHIQAANLQAYAHLSQGNGTLAAGDSVFHHPLVLNMPGWGDLAWLAERTSLPILVKGILNPLDVPPALDAGAAGFIVSNHGGRALDGVPATLEALPAIAAATRGEVPVLLDGGIRRGTDVIKALALGACAVLVGRPILHGLAVAGASGVAHVLNLLRTEFEMGMVLCGAKTLDELGPDIIYRP